MRLPWKHRQSRPKLATDHDQMTVIEHLAELRMRIIRSLLAVVLGAVLVFVFYDPVLGFLQEPYQQVCADNPQFGCTGDFLLTAPLQGFNTRLRISFYGGLVLALPVVMWQIWRFIVPGLNPNERKYARPFIVATIVFFVLGAVLAYFTAEKALAWLVSYSGENATAAFTPDAYVTFVTILMAAFGVGFLFPVLLVFLELAGVLDYRQLSSWRRFALVTIVVAAAILTPGGDPISLLALSVPMYLLYEGSILIGWLIERRRAKSANLAAGAA